MLTLTGLLLKREGSLTYEAMTTALQDVHSDEPVDKRVVSTVICGLRKRLPPTVKVTTDWGVGFYMDKASKDALRAILANWEGVR
jgi:DNA-binding response OmpR family regulator